MSYKPKVGHYVSWEDSDKELRYGKVVSDKDGKIKVTPLNPTDKEKDGIEQAASAFSKLAQSTWSEISFQAMPNLWEVVENSIVSTGYRMLVNKQRAMSAENASFMIADLLHEYLSKPFSNTWAEMLGPTSLNKDADSIFRMSDITDSLRKLPFVCVYQQLIQMFLYKKPLSHALMRNVIENTGILSVSNFADRMFFKDTTKTPQYSYP